MDKVVLYGAGRFGQKAYNLLRFQERDDVIFAFCDKDYSSIKSLYGIDVISYSNAREKGLDFVITVGEKSEAYKEIESLLIKDKIRYYRNILDYEMNGLGIEKNIYYRDCVAIAHIDTCYYNDAAKKENLDIYWNEDSVFYRMFSQLDLQNVIELACGRGRHVPFYVNKAGSITLVDILEKNIKYCKEAYKDFTNIEYYCNNGSDLTALNDGEYSSIFSYDAMVHFEMMDVLSYLKETYRVLRKGGLGLFHHSNDSSDYRSWFGECANSSMRSFMDKNIFAYLASRCGLEIVEQTTIDWEGNKDIDCITLVSKP